MAPTSGSAAGSNSQLTGPLRSPPDSALCHSPASNQSDETASMATNQSSNTVDLHEDTRACADTSTETDDHQLIYAPELASSPAASNQSERSAKTTASQPPATPPANDQSGLHNQQQPPPAVELRLLVRRREAGALIGKRGSNIKRLREHFRSSMFTIPDTGNGPERIVCIATNDESLDPILTDITQLLMEKSPENDDQIELKLLIHSSHAGSIIGVGGQSIKKLRNDSKAAIKIYEMCCPMSNERVCAIKAKPPVVVSTVRLVYSILGENPIKGTIKPYDALYFDFHLVDKYGGYLPEDTPLDLMAGHGHFERMAFGRQLHETSSYLMKPYSVWRSPDFKLNQRTTNQADSVQTKPAAAPEQLTKRGLNERQDTNGLTNAQKLDKSSPKQSPSAAARPLDSAIDHEQPQPTKSIHIGRPLPVRYHPYAAMMGDQMGLMAQAAAVDRQLMARHQHLPLTAASPGKPTGAAYQRGVHYAQHPATPVSPHMRSPQLIGMPLASLRYQMPMPIERCGHDRPCLCMFLPMAPEVVAPEPYVQFGKNFTYLRSPAYGYKKK